MPLPVAALGAVALSTIIIPLAVKLLVGLGVGFVTFTGITLLLDTVLNNIQSSLDGTDAVFVQVRNLLAFMNVDRAITILASAVTMRATLRGLQAGGDFKRLRMS